MRSFLFGLMLAAFVLPAAAQTLPGTPASPDTPEGLVGDAVLYFVGGRTREEAGGDEFNPFGMDADSLLFHVGAFFIVSEFTGEPVKEGDLSIYPQFAMPRGAGTPSAETPPIIPFALLQQGTCHAGYVTGFPVPDTVYDLDLSDAICHADTVEQILHDAYQTAQAPTQDPIEDPIEEPTAPAEEPAPDQPPGFDPASPLDLELQNAVYAAYNAAYSLAVGSADYYFWDGSDFGPTRDAIVAALADQGLSRVTVGDAPVAGPAEARACAAPGTTELRIAFTPDRLGITVAAASSDRVYAYEYDYAISPDLRVTEARTCATSGPGRAGSRSS